MSSPPPVSPTGAATSRFPPPPPRSNFPPPPPVTPTSAARFPPPPARTYPPPPPVAATPSVQQQFPPPPLAELPPPPPPIEELESEIGAEAVAALTAAAASSVESPPSPPQPPATPTGRPSIPSKAPPPSAATARAAIAATNITRSPPPPPAKTPASPTHGGLSGDSPVLAAAPTPLPPSPVQHSRKPSGDLSHVRQPAPQVASVSHHVRKPSSGGIQPVSITRGSSSTTLPSINDASDGIATNGTRHQYATSTLPRGWTMPTSPTNSGPASPTSPGSAPPRLGDYQFPPIRGKRGNLQAFISQAFPLIDQLLLVMKLMDDEHPLAQMLVETALSVREILNCYHHGRLHSVAAESLNERHKRVAEELAVQIAACGIRIKGDMEKNSQRGWLTRPMNVKLHQVFSLKGDSEAKSFNCHDITAVQELRTGIAPEFVVGVQAKDKAGKLSPVKAFHFRTKNDADRQKWMSFFHLYKQQNRATDCIESMSVSEKLELLTGSIHRPLSNKRDIPSKAREFLFATSGTGIVSEDEANITTLDEETKEAESKDHKADSKEAPKVTVVLAPAAKNAEKKIRLRTKMGIMERFKVGWPQTIGKDKPRDIEIDLTAPRRISFFKPNEKKGKDAGGVLESTPDMVFSRLDFLDYKVTPKTLEIELAFKPGKFRRKFVFPNEAMLTRFVDLLIMFQNPPDGERFEFIHQDVLHVLSHIKSSSAEGKTGEGGASKRLLALTGAEVNGDSAPVIDDWLDLDEQPNVQQLPQSATAVSLAKLTEQLREADGGERVLTAGEREELTKEMARLKTLLEQENEKNLRDAEKELEAVDGGEGFEVREKSTGSTGSTGSSGGKHNEMKEEDEKEEARIEGLGVFKAQLRSLFTAMADMAPNNTHCVALAKKSDSLPLDHWGDLVRIKLLCSKIYAVGEGDVTGLACRCNPQAPTSSSPCLLLMFRAFIACQGLQDLRRFLQSKREDIQMWTLKAVWQTFTIKHSTFRCVGPLINYEPAWAPTRFPFIWYVEAASRSRPLTEGAVDVLFEILVGGIRLDLDLGNHDEKTGQPISEPKKRENVNVMSRPIVEPSVIPVLLHCLTRAAPHICEIGLQNFVLLLKDKANALPILSRGGWQNWMFPLFLEGDMNEAVVKDPRGSIFKLSMTLLTTLHYEYMALNQVDLSTVKQKASLKVNVVFSTMELLIQFAGWSHQTASLCRMMFLSLFNKLKVKARDFTGNHNFQQGWIYENFFSLTQTVEEFMFYRPVYAKGQRPIHPSGIPLSYEEDCGIHVDQNFVPLDAPLVEKVVETLVAMGMARGDTTGDKDEKAIKARGAKEHEFFQLTFNNMRGIAGTVREHERAKFLEGIRAKIDERNKTSLFCGPKGRFTDLTRGLRTATAAQPIQYRAV